MVDILQGIAQNNLSDESLARDFNANKDMNEINKIVNKEVEKVQQKTGKKKIKTGIKRTGVKKKNLSKKDLTPTPEKFTPIEIVPLKERADEIVRKVVLATDVSKLNDEFLITVQKNLREFGVRLSEDIFIPSGSVFQKIKNVLTSSNIGELFVLPKDERTDE